MGGKSSKEKRVFPFALLIWSTIFINIILLGWFSIINKPG
jgi:hypothetical protein